MEKDSLHSIKLSIEKDLSNLIKLRNGKDLFKISK